MISQEAKDMLNSFSSRVNHATQKCLEAATVAMNFAHIGVLEARYLMYAACVQTDDVGAGYFDSFVYAQRGYGSTTRLGEGTFYLYKGAVECAGFTWAPETIDRLLRLTDAERAYVGAAAQRCPTFERHIITELDFATAYHIMRRDHDWKLALTEGGPSAVAETCGVGVSAPKATLLFDVQYED